MEGGAKTLGGGAKETVVKVAKVELEEVSMGVVVTAGEAEVLEEAWPKSASHGRVYDEGVEVEVADPAPKGSLKSQFESPAKRRVKLSPESRSKSSVFEFMLFMRSLEVVEVAVTVVEEAPLLCRTVRGMAPSVFEGVVVEEGGG